MKFITFSGPPSSGKSSVIINTIKNLKADGTKVGVVKFDCLYTDDDILYKNAGILVKKGLSGGLCPDHFFVSNIEEIINWGEENELDILITESAGLCNRCSPYLKNILGICVIDNLSGAYTPMKIGPMLRNADIVVITKGDIVSQGEREVFASKVMAVNPRATVMNINGLSGQGTYEFSMILKEKSTSLDDKKNLLLRYPMPTALCSYCLGETRVGEEYQLGNVKKIRWSMKIKEIIEKYPFAENYFTMNKLDIKGHENLSFHEFLGTLPETYFEEGATDIKTLEEGLGIFIESMLKFLGESEIKSLTILAGCDKNGEKENFDSITLNKSDVIAVVGPTGSGKSRLLADIEWMAQGDTPTKRKILINGQEPTKKMRFSIQDKIVAELSQNMNFVMDLTVKEFIELHCKARLVNPLEKIDKIIGDANYLAGEKFSLNSHITQLSGGQSRALMISDTANLSKSPIVLIDEIENAGIDRKKAIELLMSQEKIVLMSTHDPTLALSADKRIIIKNGGILKIIETDDEERKVLDKLEKTDKFMETLRENLRKGEKIGLDY